MTIESVPVEFERRVFRGLRIAIVAVGIFAGTMVAGAFVLHTLRRELEQSRAKFDELHRHAARSVELGRVTEGLREIVFATTPAEEGR